LNYVGAVVRDEMLAERPNVEQAVQAVFSREGFTVRRAPDGHAGGKWSLRYERASGGSGNLEIDINYLFRVLLWPVTYRDSHPLGSWRAMGIPVLDTHELVAGKLAALLARQQARDLFDSHQVLQMDGLDSHRLRVAFVVYGAMNRKDWRTVSREDLEFDAMDLARQLHPTLRVNVAAEHGESTVFGARLVRECQERLSSVLPFTDSERAFLDLLLDHGVIAPALLTADTQLQQRIQTQPLLEWKALNVRRHKLTEL